MKIKLFKRPLNKNEVQLLINEIKKFPNPLTDEKTWRSLEKVYVLYLNKNIVGVCGIIQLDNWLKLGPFVIFKKFHGQGFGKKIFESIITDNPSFNFYIGSRNPAVARIALKNGFQEEKNIWKLPNMIKYYLLKNIIQSLTIHYFKEFIRKKPTSEGPYRFFLKQVN
jgi:RimJ/RimL family protein N-acetyltransferase